ncbi:hypothetical protein pb186bvf_019397 [Paramecium bursaria]
MNNEKQRKSCSPKESIDDEFIKGISRTDSLKKIGLSKQKNQLSMDLQEMNILGLKDYYLNSESKDTSTQLEYRHETSNHNLDQLGQKLNEVIGQYLAEITQQSRFSLDSLSLQNSESLDEEHQQQIIDWELNTIRQKIYRNIVEKINLSVIQSVQTQNSFSESQNHLITSGAQISQISFKSPPKSLAHSLVDINIQMQKKIEEQVNSLNEYDPDLSKEEILNKLKMSIQLNTQLLSINNQLRDELKNKEQIDIIQSEYEQMKIENAKLIQENLKLKQQIMSQDQT